MLPFTCPTFPSHSTLSSPSDHQYSLTSHLTTLTTLPFCSLITPHQRFPPSKNAYQISSAAAFLIAGTVSHPHAVAVGVEQLALPPSKYADIVWTVRIASGREELSAKKLEALRGFVKEVEGFINGNHTWNDVQERHHNLIHYHEIYTHFLPLLVHLHLETLLHQVSSKAELCELTYKYLLSVIRTTPHAHTLDRIPPVLFRLADLSTHLPVSSYDEQVESLVQLLTSSNELMWDEKFLGGMDEVWALVPKEMRETLIQLDTVDNDGGYDCATDASGYDSRRYDSGCPLVRFIIGMGRWGHAVGTVISNGLKIRVKSGRRVQIRVEVLKEEERCVYRQPEKQAASLRGTREKEDGGLYVHPEVKLALHYLTSPGGLRPLSNCIGSSSSHCLACQVFFQQASSRAPYSPPPASRTTTDLRLRALGLYLGNQRRWIYYLQRSWPDGKKAVEAVRPDASWKVPVIEGEEEGGLTREEVEEAVGDTVKALGCTIGRWRCGEVGRGWKLPEVI